MAAAAGVKGVRTSLDQWADHITRLAGDEVVADATADLLVAMVRAGKLPSEETVRLLVQHLRESKALASGGSQ